LVAARASEISQLTARRIISHTTVLEASAYSESGLPLFQASTTSISESNSERFVHPLRQPPTIRANLGHYLVGATVNFNRRRIAVKVCISPQFHASWCSFDDQILLAQAFETNYVA
jgi:hypothetical protein